jgi:hypothetical protein
LTANGAIFCLGARSGTAGFFATVMAELWIIDPHQALDG